MLKNNLKLMSAIKRSENLMARGITDKLPLGIRGELEVIAKDRDGNILSYERGHNQVTDQAKMQIIHLLAGEVGVSNQLLYSRELTGDYAGYKHFALDGTVNDRPVLTGFDKDSHTTAKNEDGCLISGEQFFTNVATDELDQMARPLKDNLGTSLKANYPVKMLFGTGLELEYCKEDAECQSKLMAAYASAMGSSVAMSTINKVNGFNNSAEFVPEFYKPGFIDDTERLTNFYSNSAFKARTLQPIDVTKLPATATPTANDSAITGAIKNCYITSTASDAERYDEATKMAKAQYRGFGMPAYIYAKRTTKDFYDKNSLNYVHYSRNTDYLSAATGNANVLTQTPYETELTFAVVMPAQPADNQTVSSFYPYNGWVLKQAGLFSDARYMLQSDVETGSDAYLSTVGTIGDARYNNGASGMLLFKRNLESPVLKTPDIEISFLWHIYIVLSNEV